MRIVNSKAAGGETNHTRLRRGELRREEDDSTVDDERVWRKEHILGHLLPSGGLALHSVRIRVRVRALQKIQEQENVNASQNAFSQTNIFSLIMDPWSSILDFKLS